MLEFTCYMFNPRFGGGGGRSEKKRILLSDSQENARVLNEDFFSFTHHPLKMKAEHVNM
jgi:hypothetical protein